MSFVSVHNYTGQAWLTDFSFAAMRDSVGGFTEFVSQPVAQTLGLYNIDGNGRFSTVVDTTTYDTNQNGGRKSLNLTTTRSFRHGLFVIDANNVPVSLCSSWPSIYLVDAYDNSKVRMALYDNFNTRVGDAYAVYPLAACTAPASLSSFPQTAGPNCLASTGCAWLGANASGSNFDAAGGNTGGYIVLHWSSDRIAMWSWDRNSAPSDLLSANPNPNNWPSPMVQATTAGGCPIDTAFPGPLKIQVNHKFCGFGVNGLTANGSGTAYPGDGCTGTCTQTAAQNSFSAANYTFNGLYVYQNSTDTTSSSNDVCNTPIVEPTLLNNSVSLGCYNDSTAFTGFNLQQVSDNMTPAVCIGICSSLSPSLPYSGINGRGCYCAASITKNQ